MNYIDIEGGMMKKKRLRVFLMTFCVLFFSYPVLAGQGVKIAIVCSMSGLGMKANQDVLKCARLTIKQINENGGLLGHPVEKIELDDKSTPIGSREAALKAIQENVTVVVGTSWSSLSLVIAPILQEAGIPMISPSSTHPDVTKTGNYIFRACFTDTFQGKVLVWYALQDLKAQTAAILINTSSDYSMGLAGVFRESFIDGGGKIVHEGKYRKEMLDFNDLLSVFSSKSKTTKSVQPDVIFVPGHSRDSGLIVKQAISMGIKSTFLGGDAWQSITQYPDAAKAAEGSYFSSHWHSDVDSPSNRRLKENFKKKFGKTISAFGPVVMHDAINLVADAVTRAGTTDQKKIRDAIADTKGFKGASGTITFNENGDPVNKEAVILTFKQGEIKFIKSIKP